MSLRLVQSDLQERCLRLARLIADQLANQQFENGNFPQHSFYAKAYTVALWQNLSDDHYTAKIRAAVNALKTEIQDHSYHRQFIEYALENCPDINAETRNAILRNAPYQSPNVANWHILAMRIRQSGSWRDKLRAKLDWLYTRTRFWRAPVFMDRPGCFSAQYHAFCVALLTDSPIPAQRKIAAKATDLIAQLCATTGIPNLVGRGAGQSFGATTALYALLKHGYRAEAEAILFRLEQTLLQTETLPLNLLAPNPLPDDPGPDNPQTPGWYSYNRHYDYLAFTGFWLLRAAIDSSPEPAPTIGANADFLLIHDTDHYHARMCLRGKSSYEITPAPVLITNGHVFLPPSGGEEDFSSLYGPASLPLPAFAGQQAWSTFTSGTISDSTAKILFRLAGRRGQRDITFNENEIVIHDQVDTDSLSDLHLFRLLVPAGLAFEKPGENRIDFPDLNLHLIADQPLHITDDGLFAVTGPVRTIFVPNQGTAALHILWRPS
ncbi:hypothetical protein [Thalassospira xiamenensis]|uniref:hypothetical protein n=1 Tax=Thalassospira xiamenensis TaxID=220697 RepID=UPI000DEE15FE|nr:hypothetical protein [Thalassospira xiamenensis]RCK40072.1 hypothetical protein TH24_11970 [Thalassospira xiamenensis]